MVERQVEATQVIGGWPVREIKVLENWNLHLVAAEVRYTWPEPVDSMSFVDGSGTEIGDLESRLVDLLPGLVVVVNGVECPITNT